MIATALTADMVLGGDSCHNQALYVPCPCHDVIADFPPGQTLHLDLEATRHTVAQLTALHKRDDVWVLLAHEFEAVFVVPQETDLADWLSRGYKRRIGEVRQHLAQAGCHAS